MHGSRWRREETRTSRASTAARSGRLSPTLLHRSSSTPTQKPTSTYSTQRTRVLSPGEVANIATGKALHLDGVKWELVTLTPAHRTEPWRTLTAPTPTVPPAASS